MKTKYCIYTYSDPFYLRKTEFWEKIKSYPHFCVSQTLVQGLTSYHKRNRFGIINTIKAFEDQMFFPWNEPYTKLAQYVILSDLIDEIDSPSIKRAFKFNQAHLLEAVRCLMELDIRHDQLVAKSPVQTIFNDLYRKVSDNPDFPRILSRISGIVKPEPQNEVAGNGVVFKDVLIEMLEKEIQGHILSSNKDHIENLISEYRSGKNIEPGLVFHGVHQLSPLLLKMCHELNILGIKIIFLFNYMEQYPRIYDTWRQVYSWTGNVEWEHDNGYHFNTANKQKTLATAMGSLLEGGRGNRAESSPLYVFDNMTSFADYVGDIFEQSEHQLSNMDEQFYATDNSMVNHLLENYFPEQFGEKHFLSYPVGQFILGLYNMWEEDKGLVISASQLKSCLATNFIHVKGMPEPLEIYRKLESYLNNIDTVPALLDQLTILEEKLEELEGNEKLQGFKYFSFYAVTREEIQYFKGIIEDLYSIARELFSDSTRSGRIDYGKHFSKLVEILRRRLKSNLQETTDEEKLIIEELYNKFQHLERLKLKGSVTDLKEAVHYYLKTRSDSNDGNWIVREFEQIDGGVLLSRGQINTPKYHLCMVSDKLMRACHREVLPWPLSEEMFISLDEKGEGYTNLKAVVNSRKRYSEFLRFSFFYGTYFLGDERVCISYVRDLEEEQDPYFVLPMLGIKPGDLPVYSFGSFDINLLADYLDHENTTVDIDDNFELTDLQVFRICQRRYILGPMLEGKRYFSDDYHCWLLYRQLLLRNTHKSFDLKANQSWQSIAEEENNLFKPFMSHWRNNDFHDVENWVIRDEQWAESAHSIDHRDYAINLRTNFLYARLDDEEGNNTLAPLWRLMDTNMQRIIKSELISFLKGLEPEGELPKLIVCEYCEHRELCLQHLLINADPEEG